MRRIDGKRFRQSGVCGTQPSACLGDALVTTLRCVRLAQSRSQLCGGCAMYQSTDVFMSISWTARPTFRKQAKGGPAVAVLDTS